MKKNEPKSGLRTTEVYITGTAGVALAAALTTALESGQEIAASGCALALAIVGVGYALSRARAKGGAA